MNQPKWTHKLNHMLTQEELIEIEAHQRFILQCEDSTIVGLLIRQLEFHADPLMKLETTFLGGNVLLTPELAARMVHVLKELRKA
jgi:hypothetical protein